MRPTLSNRIKAYMALKNVKARDMAKSLRISDRAWRYWLEDPDTRISVGEFKVICAMLQVEPNALLQDVQG